MCVEWQTLNAAPRYNLPTDGRTDWRTDGRTDERTDGRADGRIDGRTDGRPAEQTDLPTSERTDWPLDGLMGHVRMPQLTCKNTARTAAVYNRTTRRSIADWYITCSPQIERRMDELIDWLSNRMYFVFTEKWSVHTDGDLNLIAQRKTNTMAVFSVWKVGFYAWTGWTDGWTNVP